MGNTPVKVGVQIEGSAEAGSCLKGKVYLSVQKQGQLGRGVFLKLEGQERSEIVRDHESSERRIVDRSSSTLVCMEVPLAIFESGVVPRGQHEFPFEWPLPHNLPSSMIFNNGHSFCRIEYKLTAYLDGSAQLLQNYTSSITVPMLGASQREHSGPIQLDMEEFPIRACCDNKGTMMMGWDADTTIAAPRHTMTVGIFGKNESVTRVEYLSAKIVETISWNANGRSMRKSRTLCSAKLYTDMNDLWQPLAKKPSRRHRRYNEVETDTSVFENRIAVPLQLPTDSRDTYTGHVLGVSHSLVVTAVTPGACCITSPESSISIQVQRKMPSESACVPVPVTATAPSAELDVGNFAADSFTEAQQQLPMAVAQVLPDNWTPKQHDVVVIPSACLTSTDDSNVPIATAQVVPTAPMESEEPSDVDLFESYKPTMT